MGREVLSRGSGDAGRRRARLAVGGGLQRGRARRAEDERVASRGQPDGWVLRRRGEWSGGDGRDETPPGIKRGRREHV
jgi:hypothetical protein